MASLSSLLSEYGESYRNLTNKLVPWVCVPLIMFSLFGLLLQFVYRRLDWKF